MHTEERLRLSGAENTGGETGGLMLSINGLHNFYYLPELHDMRCKAQRICEIIRGRYHRDPLNGDVYMFMSKDQRKVRMIHYERNAYYLHEKSFIKGYKFMKIERKDDETVYKIDWKDLSSEEKEKQKRVAALIKLKEVKVFSTKDLLKPKDVVSKVQEKLGNPKVIRGGKQVDKFNSDTHTRCWKKYKVRPDEIQKKRSPEKVKAEYCVYDHANDCYLYKNAWVDFLVEKMLNDDEYNSLY